MEEVDGYMLEEVDVSELRTGDMIWDQYCTLPVKWMAVTVEARPDGRYRVSTYSGENDVSSPRAFGRRAGLADDRTLMERWSRGDAHHDQIEHLIGRKFLCRTDGRIFKTAKGEQLLGR
jgi:hypothetical protein